MSEVGTRKVFENEKTIVWELFLEPGEGTGRHTHRHGYMFYVTEGGCPDAQLLHRLSCQPRQTRFPVRRLS